MENTEQTTFTEASGDVRSSINYMKAMAQRPARYLCTPPPGTPELNWQLEAHAVQVYDGRPRLSSLSIEHHGFTLRRAACREVTQCMGKALERSIYGKAEWWVSLRSHPL